MLQVCNGKKARKLKSPYRRSFAATTQIKPWKAMNLWKRVTINWKCFLRKTRNLRCCLNSTLFIINLICLESIQMLNVINRLSGTMGCARTSNTGRLASIPAGVDNEDSAKDPCSIFNIINVYTSRHKARRDVHSQTARYVSIAVQSESNEKSR